MDKSVIIFRYLCLHIGNFIHVFEKGIRHAVFVLSLKDRKILDRTLGMSGTSDILPRDSVCVCVCVCGSGPK